MADHLDLPLSEIYLDEEMNCRGKIAPLDVMDLVSSMRQLGLIQSITVKQLDPTTASRVGRRYKVIAGFRRTKAAMILKWTTIPANINHSIDTEADERMFNLAENMERCNLTLLQEANAIKQLIDLGITQEAMAKHINRSRGWVQIRMMLLSLPQEIQQDVDAGLIKQTNIRELYAVQRSKPVEQLFAAARKIKDATSRGMTVTVSPSKLKVTSKHQRSRGEIFALLEYALQYVPAGLWSKFAAWSAGEISDVEIHLAFSEFAKKLGKTYITPAEPITEKAVTVNKRRRKLSQSDSEETHAKEE